jgi:hypothetical protein
MKRLIQERERIVGSLKTIHGKVYDLLERIVKYVLYNPVKANLVNEQKDWKWTYCKYDM